MIELITKYSIPILTAIIIAGQVAKLILKAITLKTKKHKELLTFYEKIEESLRKVFPQNSEKDNKKISKILFKNEKKEE